MPDARIHEELSKVWSFGRIISSSSGFHAEFRSNENQLESYDLLYLGVTEEEALGMMLRLTGQY